jgi:hypothetical protein
MRDSRVGSIGSVLYLVTFDKDPRERVDQIADLFIEQRDCDELNTLVREIDRELSEPTQQVNEILPLAHSPSERVVREFLRGVAAKLKEHLRKPQAEQDLRKSQEAKQVRTLREYNGPCSVCGKPGCVQQIPRAPVSSCFCEDHVPSDTIKPFSMLIALGLLLGLGWLIYTLLGR